jgi:hypothetical protein
MRKTKMSRKSINEDTLTKNLSIVLGVMSVIAIVGLLINSRFETNEVLSSIINLTQVAVPVIVLVFMKSLKSDLKSYEDIGREALKKLQKENESFLEGPRPHSNKSSNPDKSKDDEDSEADAGVEYLFIRHHEYPKKLYRSKFIDLADLDNGVLSISVQKNTLVWGLGYPGGRDNNLQSEITELHSKVYERVVYVIEKSLRKDLYRIEDKARCRADVAIRIDFDEERMKKSKFAAMIHDCGKAAMETIRDYPRPKNNARNA